MADSYQHPHHHPILKSPKRNRHLQRRSQDALPQRKPLLESTRSLQHLDRGRRLQEPAKQSRSPASKNSSNTHKSAPKTSQKRQKPSTPRLCWHELKKVKLLALPEGKPTSIAPSPTLPRKVQCWRLMTSAKFLSRQGHEWDKPRPYAYSKSQRPRL